MPHNKFIQSIRVNKMTHRYLKNLIEKKEGMKFTDEGVKNHPMYVSNKANLKDE